MEQMRKLPIGIQTFEKLREESYLYVDKTAIIYQIVSGSIPYFLSRPRRFGKSLLISTFESYFEGRKELFEGLAIEKLETRWEQYPVLHLDLNAEKYDTKEALEQMLSRSLSLWEERWGSDVAEISLSARFSGIIRRAYERTGKQAVVLIDEYDKPLLQAILNEPLLDEYRRILKAFYGVLKSSDRYLRFVFQTGTPTYLVDLLKQSDYDLRLLVAGVEVTASAFSEYRTEANNPLPMIYQSGYLTIKGYDREVRLYTLRFPNDEIRYGFLNFLVPFYTRVTDDETGFHIAKFMRELRAGDVDAFMERLKLFFAGIPYDLSDNTERHYQAIFYIVFTLMGQFVETEVRSARSRADAVVKTRDAIYVFEFKLDGKRLVKVGVNFSKETRNVDRYIMEE
ncbi:ATP-binding protein [Bacteroides fluxus]|uniref:ATP-binding protein n=1 Tax=Bacteroides fluxus TaxID=626930 RepID=UPI0023A877A1|nr:ATP-binding protein [Bacteroides fluxus]